MKITIESTDEWVVIADCKMRVWKGRTAGGIPVEVYGVILGVDYRPGLDLSEIERDLDEVQLAPAPPPKARLD